MVIPTLAADSTLEDCLGSLDRQTCSFFEVIVVDNSGRDLAKGRCGNARVIGNTVNVGFGTAINQGIQASSAPYIATLNDDAIAAPGWIGALLRAAEEDGNVGMYASQIRLHPAGTLDSAGMLLCGDGSSKQRGHGREITDFSGRSSALLPSGAAALYRRSMLQHVGGFDDDFFLYCEDTDLGLRAAWGGWRCVYVPDAIVYHRYSHSAGRASAVKAYYVERNRLYVVAKNFPPAMLLRVPALSVVRYFWHLVYALKGEGAAAEFRQERSGLVLIGLVLRAHLALLLHLPALLRKRRSVRRHARIGTRDFVDLVSKHGISPKQVAAH